MAWLFSLRTRLIVLYTGLILLGFGGLAWWAGQQITTAAEEDFEHRTESEAALIAQALAEPIEEYLEGEINESDVQHVLDTYAEKTEADLILINNQGEAWLSTLSEPPQQQYFTLPEMMTARSNRITHETRSNLTGQQTIFAAAPIIEDGRIISIVQLGISVDKVQGAIRQRWMMLTTGVLLLAALAIILSILLSSSLLHPLFKLQAAAEQLSNGNFSIYVPVERRDEIGQVARTFKQMAQQLQAMIEEQRAFASNASHELRTPITTIRLRTEALCNGTTDTATAQRYISEIDQEAQRLTILINDLILLSRFEVGSAEIGRQMIDLPRFAQHLVREMIPAAEQKHVQINCNASPDVPPVAANLSHLDVVFRNILDNAVKYMPEAGGEICWEMSIEKGMLVSMITDTGRGIAADDLPHVLKRFYRADKSRNRSTPGTGLGLALVNSIVKTYGGEIIIQSEGIGHGIQVIVRWPIQLPR